MKTAISEASIKAMLTREKALFIQRNPKSKGHSDNAARNWLRGVPMHWMVDWGTPFPLFVEKAEGVDLTVLAVQPGRPEQGLVHAPLRRVPHEPQRLLVRALEHGPDHHRGREQDRDRRQGQLHGHVLTGVGPGPPGDHEVPRIVPERAPSHTGRGSQPRPTPR